jgi:16S rRNA G1207 methylase RsmC
MLREGRENEWEHYFAEKPKTRSKVKRIRAFLRGREFVFETDRSVFAKDYVDMGTKRLIEKVQLPSMFEKSSFMRGKKRSISPLPRPNT